MGSPTGIEDGLRILCLPIMGISMTIYLLNHISQDMQNLMRGDW